MMECKGPVRIHRTTSSTVGRPHQDFDVSIPHAAGEGAAKRTKGQASKGNFLLVRRTRRRIDGRALRWKCHFKGGHHKETALAGRGLVQALGGVINAMGGRMRWLNALGGRRRWKAACARRAQTMGGRMRWLHAMVACAGRL